MNRRLVGLFLVVCCFSGSVKAQEGIKIGFARYKVSWGKEMRLESPFMDSNKQIIPSGLCTPNAHIQIWFVFTDGTPKNLRVYSFGKTYKVTTAEGGWTVDMPMTNPAWPKHSQIVGDFGSVGLDRAFVIMQTGKFKPLPGHHKKK